MFVGAPHVASLWAHQVVYHEAFLLASPGASHVCQRAFPNDLQVVHLASQAVSHVASSVVPLLDVHV